MQFAEFVLKDTDIPRTFFDDVIKVISCSDELFLEYFVDGLSKDVVLEVFLAIVPIFFSVVAILIFLLAIGLENGRRYRREYNKNFYNNGHIEIVHLRYCYRPRYRSSCFQHHH